MKNSHGDKCSCQMLSLAVTGRPDACSYVYCKKVLQRHWTMSCNHGQLPLSEEPTIHDEVVLHEDNTLELLKKVLR